MTNIWNFLITASFNHSLDNYIKRKTSVKNFNFQEYIKKINEKYGYNLKIDIGVKNLVEIHSITYAFEEMIQNANESGIKDISFFD